MRRLLAFFLIASTPLAAAAVAAPAQKAPPARPAASASPPSALAAAQARLEALKKARLTPAYGEAQLDLARAHRATGRLAAALEAASAAARSFDEQVELHKALSEVLMTYEYARSERAAARAAGLKRDEAFLLVGELAQAMGDPDVAVRHFVMVVSSQPDTPLGARALAALAALGFVSPPSPSPSPSKAP